MSDKWSISTGSKYRIIINGPSNITKGRVAIHLRSPTHNMIGINTIGVVLSKEKLQQVIEQLQQRLSEM